MRYAILIAAFIFLLSACKTHKTAPVLPYLGVHEVEGKDTTYYSVPGFNLMDQDSQMISNNDFKGNLYVADFFFTRCPSICPIMKRNMLQVYDHFAETNGILFLSHTIDPENDTVPVLKDYAERLNVTADKWHFVYGTKEVIYPLAKDYYIAAVEDEEAPGGYEHSGAFTLVDGDGHIRGFYDGTKKESVPELIADIELLLNEE